MLSAIVRPGAAACGAAVTLEMTGQRGSRMVVRARAWARRWAAGAMRGEWNAPATERGAARRPLEEAAAAARSMAALEPERTIWPGELKLAQTRTSPPRASSQTAWA